MTILDNLLFHEFNPAYEDQNIGNKAFKWPCFQMGVFKTGDTAASGWKILYH